MRNENMLLYVTAFLSVKDVIHLTSTCVSLYTYDEIWQFFYYYYKERLCVKQRKQLKTLNYIYYGKYKTSIYSFYVKKIWSRFSIEDQIQCFANRKIIVLYFIAIMLEHGKKIIYNYNRCIKNNHIKSRTKIKWMCSSWEILKGKRTKLFRRNYLPVY